MGDAVEAPDGQLGKRTMQQYYQRKSSGHPARLPDGGFEQKCDYCAKVFRAVSSDALAKRHYRSVRKEVPMKVLPLSTPAVPVLQGRCATRGAGEFLGDGMDALEGGSSSSCPSGHRAQGLWC